MTAIKHKHSPASGAAGGWAAHPPLDPRAAEIEVRLHVYISNCWNEEELQFPAANLSGTQSSASALSPGRRRRCPLPFGDAGRGKHAAAPLAASAQALSRGWQGGLSPYPAGKLKKSYFVLGRIQEPLKSWERSAGQANPSLLSLPAFQSHSAGISPRRAPPRLAHQLLELELHTGVGSCPPVQPQPCGAQSPLFSFPLGQKDFLVL
ncbi:hypothetical protein LUU34_01147000 [Aix galericulata]|nr:hypothetical protein LUU34_01147000 [Aix galericulata]